MTGEKHKEVRRLQLSSDTGSGKQMTKMKKSVAVAGLAAAAAMGMSLTFAGSASAELVGPSCTAYAEKVPTGPGSVAGMAMDPVAVAASNNPMLTMLTKA